MKFVVYRVNFYKNHKLRLEIWSKNSIIYAKFFISKWKIQAMQNKAHGAVLALLMTSLLAAPLAEAKRAGGGKSHGMSRSNTSSQSYQQPRQAAPAPQQTAPQKSGPGVGTMVAAGVAGAAVGAVAANAMADDQPATEQQAAQTEEKGGIPSWIWVLLAAALAFFVFRKLGQKKN